MPSSFRFTPFLAPAFASRIVARGRAYHRQGAVRLIDGSATAVAATVRGSRTYRVGIELKTKQLLTTCTCPYATNHGELCKHLWAVLLAAEAAGHLDGLALLPSVQVVNQATDLPFTDDDDDDFDDDEFADQLDADSANVIPLPPRRPAPPPEWETLLEGLRQVAPYRQEVPTGFWPEGRHFRYLVKARETLAGDGVLSLEIGYVEHTAAGGWSKLRSQYLTAEQIAALPDPADRRILSVLLGLAGYSMGYSPSLVSHPSLRPPFDTLLIPEMCATGRAFIIGKDAAPDAEPTPLKWDDGEPWRLALTAAVRADGSYAVAGELRRPDARFPLADADLLLGSGLVFYAGTAARLAPGTPFPLVVLLRKRPRLTVPANQLDEFSRGLLEYSGNLTLDLPEDRRWTTAAVAPVPVLRLADPADGYGRGGRLAARPHFDYAGETIGAADPRQQLIVAAERRLVPRDRAAETAAMGRLWPLGFTPPPGYRAARGGIEISPRLFPVAVTALLDAGWRVEAPGGKPYQAAGAVTIAVTSGVDWFDLTVTTDFAGKAIPFPRLLEALRSGARFIPLGDGTIGLLPEEWLKKYAPLAGLGKTEGKRLRFQRNQAALLDALLADEPAVACDEGFRRARDELRGFAGVKPLPAPAGFAGKLRDYQHLALGWFEFLQRFGFGGCLADDMGLGKTVMVLALLAGRRPGRKREPSLVVTPKTLAWNWQAEAARFSPELKALVHAGPRRDETNRRFAKHDLVITTYDILVRDLELFRDLDYHYLVLDEAPAVKNPATARSKAVRLLRGKHRLALSGTPIENHLGELWTLFEFLNPGLLGSAGIFRRLAAPAGAAPDAAARSTLARALRPFILRRTKDQVLKELPPKTEQTVFCEMEAEQKKLYHELRDHYRAALLPRLDAKGLAREKIFVLEALLRLRQAACHPGLIDPKRAAAESAKFETVFPMLDEVLEEGHKALVFSQFTSLLALVRRRLDARRVPYQYLDGQTRDRQAPIECFQNDPKCRLFLISLKAGGLGLNLTAADYVFILDPWWNPAAEAQAVDRAHRIGQTRPVIAYRFIVRDTVEEKVMALQQSKRALADAIINADNSLIRTLTRADLELLMS